MYMQNLENTGENKCNKNKNKIFIKAKLKKSDDQTNIDKYRLTANITVYHISKLILDESLSQTFVVQ